MLLWALDTDGRVRRLQRLRPNPVTNREFSKALGRALRPAGDHARAQVRRQGQARRRARRGRDRRPARNAAGGRRTRATGSGFPEIDAAMQDALA